MIARENGKEPETDHRCGLQAALQEVLIARTNDLIERGDRLLNLGADSTDQQITKWRHGAQNNNRPVFDPPIGLRQGREENVRHYLASPYSGSFSP